jgi:hypothetical protein
MKHGYKKWKTRDASANELKTATNPTKILKLSSFAHEKRTIETDTKITPKANQRHKAGAGSQQNKCGTCHVMPKGNCCSEPFCD